MKLIADMQLIGRTISAKDYGRLDRRRSMTCEIVI